ncbi:hypothetical protein [Nannocystis bainbridge]|uniref:Uncharacterized protein n=1 Tax=Nannocystis bainbridge TaxID=2995303 RepID=A0ABT5E9P9_9BACT|nr:hypothetical protein [Nannocystis bainbridge]MDC0722079.1 hypothetical protein [Nannocystis bainbridge]
MFDDLAPYLSSIPPGLRDQVIELRRRVAEDPDPVHVLFDVVQFKLVCHEMSARTRNPQVLKFAQVSHLLFKLAQARAG